MDYAFFGKAAIAAALSIAAGALQAAPIVFQATDPGVSPGAATPNSDAAAASFDAAAGALGALNRIDFESAPTGAFSSLAIAPGVTASGVGWQGSGSHSILGTPRCLPRCGFNTTPGGGLFLDIDGNLITISFDDGVQAFGAYITGLQLTGETVSFSDGTSQTLELLNPAGEGGVQFFGFTDAGKSITSIVIDTRVAATPFGDFIGIDDIRYVMASAVPEPGGLELLGIGLLGLAGFRRRLRT